MVGFGVWLPSELTERFFVSVPNAMGEPASTIQPLFREPTIPFVRVERDFKPLVAAAASLIGITASKHKAAIVV